MVYPLDTRGGSTIITAISNGTIAHKKSHNIRLRPFLLAIMPPTMPAIVSRITYLSNGILYFVTPLESPHVWRGKSFFLSNGVYDYSFRT
ncbi:MAG: hypothetical protein A2043_10990 [Candidatus Schekmanbacteria bacterium GWA2_38_9]|nr:MAG: hypothetical protein A2043_10990 [Candidatus Schekmanbacteria bacterium GWA2_38_9]